MTIAKIKEVAKSLIASDYGENVEYSRGICEFIADLYVDEHNDHAEKAIKVAKELEVKEKFYTQFY